MRPTSELDSEEALNPVQMYKNHLVFHRTLTNNVIHCLSNCSIDLLQVCIRRQLKGNCAQFDFQSNKGSKHSDLLRIDVYCVCVLKGMSRLSIKGSKQCYCKLCMVSCLSTRRSKHAMH